MVLLAPSLGTGQRERGPVLSCVAATLLLREGRGQALRASLFSATSSTGVARGPSSPSRPISIATNKPRKLGVTAQPSPVVPEAGTLQSPCWVW